MGHGAWGMVMGKNYYRCPMPIAQSPITHYQLPITNYPLPSFQLYSSQIANPRQTFNTPIPT
ncbi:hypothetical protein [Tolypothrix sp. VBCCA 56010]|uniref:hypothetical protein n=1 Tax=Tolypothrix sp. VBCCA 56010 TaxID=3137731 RepID=UPI003D7DBFC7